MIWNKLRIPFILLIFISALLTAMGVTTYMTGGSSRSNLTKIGGYTTYYSDSSADRKENIRLASSALNNVVILPNETLSFNSIVGAREEARGYKPALIISNGSYVKGVGGGVCQVSTTLYNAWVTTGLEVVELHAHSLPSHYVPLSRDAMVSSTTDLVLKNNQSTPIMLSCLATADSLAIKIYGSPIEYEYNLVSVMIKELVAAAPIYSYEVDPTKVGEQVVTSKGAAGYMSKGVLQKLKGGTVIEEKEIRQDYYVPSPMRITIFTATPQTEVPQE